MNYLVLLSYGIFCFFVGYCISLVNQISIMKKRIGNFHEFAIYISRQEGLKKQVNIAQIKEILSIVLKRLGF